MKESDQKLAAMPDFIQEWVSLIDRYYLPENSQSSFELYHDLFVIESQRHPFINMFHEAYPHDQELKHMVFVARRNKKGVKPFSIDDSL